RPGPPPPRAGRTPAPHASPSRPASSPMSSIDLRAPGLVCASPLPDEAAGADYYGEQSCTAGRAAFICGQNPIRTGLTKVGMPGATVGLQAEDPTIATALRA